MKVLQVIPLLCSGGAEKFTIDLSNALANKGHQVVLVTLFDKSSKSTLEDYVDSKKVKRISLHKSKGLDIRCFIRLLNLIKKEKPDVVHGHVGAIKYMMLAVTFYRKCKYVATIHSEAKREAGNGIELLARKYMFNKKLVLPVTISDESEQSFLEFYGFSGYMIPNGCSSYNITSCSINDYKKDIEFLFVHAGRLQKVKNQIILVRAFQRLLSDGVNAKLLIMGRREDVEVYNAISPYFSNNIKYIGEQKDTRVFMASADVFCLSSLIEGMPITIIEAFSVGCVPIVTPVGGCVSMIQDGKNGFLASEVSEESYYKVLKKYVSLPISERERMKQNAIETFNQKYSIVISANKYIELYSKLI